MSKFQLMTKDQEDLVAMVHDFMEKKVDPYVDQWDRESHCPMEEVRELMDLGFWGIDVPEEYGGAGLDVTTIMYIRQAMAYHDAGFTNTFSAQTFGWKPCCWPARRSRRSIGVSAWLKVLSGLCASPSLSPAPMPATAKPRLSRTAMSMSSPAARPSSPTAACPTCIP